MATWDDRTGGDERGDGFLSQRFDEYRDETMNRLRPAGALAARRSYDERRRSRLIAVAVATAAVAVLVTVGGHAVLHRSAPPLPITVSPSPEMSPAPNGTPSPTGAPLANPTSPATHRSTGAGAGIGPSVSGKATTPRCHTAELAVKYLGSDGGHGAAVRNYALTNTSNHDCSLTGVPRALAVDSSGTTLITARQQNTPGRKLVLHPDGQAYVPIQIGIGDLDGNGNKAPCGPPADAVWLTPPGETAHLTLDRQLSICNGLFGVGPFDPDYPNVVH